MKENFLSSPCPTKALLHLERFKNDYICHRTTGVEFLDVPRKQHVGLWFSDMHVTVSSRDLEVCAESLHETYNRERRMTGRILIDKRERNFHNNKRLERDTWQTESPRGQRSRTHVANKTTSSIKTIHNKGDDCSGWERNWLKWAAGRRRKPGGSREKI